MSATSELQAVWVSGRPANTTGTVFTGGMTAQQKVDAINTWQILTGVAVPAVISSYSVRNAIQFADLQTLTSLQLSELNFYLDGEMVDASIGSPARTCVTTLLAGKTTTLSALSTLVTPYDTPRQAWWLSVGFQSPVTLGDAIAAGLS
jgi:hypothetical protein